MNLSNAYWAPDVSFQKVKSKPLLDRTLGFHIDIPWPLPTTAGAYSGEGALPDRRELSYATEAESEYFATDNIVPSTGNVPMVNIYAPHFKFKRSDRVFKV